MSAAPRVDVLLTGHPPADIQATQGSFASWFEQQAGVEAIFRPVDLTAGQPAPDPHESDGWIISGSPAAVYGDLPWLAAANRSLIKAVEGDHPLLGICFGHQMLAAALGGEVTKNPGGWELGQVTVHLTAAGQSSPIFAGLGPSFSAYATHGDAVIKLPPDAELLGENDAAVQTFQVGAHAYGVQFHPEFTTAIATHYAELRKAQAGGDVVWPDTKGAVANRVLKNFIKNEIAGDQNGPTII